MMAATMRAVDRIPINNTALPEACAVTLFNPEVVVTFSIANFLFCFENLELIREDSDKFDKTKFEKI